MIRNLAFGALAVALAFVPLGGRAANEPYPVPVIISLTGPFALVGNVQKTALEMLMKTVNDDGEINQRPLQFDFLDDASSPATTVQIASRLVDQKAPLIVGPSFTATCRAVAALVTAGPVNYCMSAGGPTPKGGFSFAAGFSTVDSARTGLSYFRQRGWRRLAILTPTDATGQDGEESLEKNLALPENRAVTVVAREHFNISDISIAAQIAHIEAAKPDIIYCWTTGAPLGTVLHGLQYAGYDIPVFTSYGNLLYSAMNQFGDLAPKAGLYFTAPRFLAPNLLRGPARVAVDTFIKAADTAGVRPDAVLATEWDVGVVVADAMRHAGPNPTSDQIRRYIERIHGLPGAAATFDFRDGSQRGISAATILIARWDPAAKTFVAVSEPGGKPMTR